MRIVCAGVWEHLQAAWEAEPRQIAVAYFSDASGLSFGPRDVLVVDASDRCIAAGSSSAKALRAALDGGARVYSLPDLHAKVFVLGNSVAVGSTNVSAHSRQLVECLAVSDAAPAVAEASALIAALAAQATPVDEAFMQRIEAIPPAPRSGPTRARPPIEVQPPRCWLLGLSPKDYPGDDAPIAAHNEALSAAPEHQGQQVDWFWWPKSSANSFYTKARPGDLMVDIYTDDDGEVRVYRHARIHEITEDGNRKVFHTVWPGDADESQLSLTEFEDLMKKLGWTRPISVNSCRELPWPLACRLDELWRAGAGK